MTVAEGCSIHASTTWRDRGASLWESVLPRTNGTQHHLKLSCAFLWRRSSSEVGRNIFIPTSTALV